MNVKHRNFAVSLIIVLFVLLLFLPKIIDLIPSEEIKYSIIIIFSTLVLLLLIYLAYSDIRKKEYTTTMYIVLLDIIGIISYVYIGYVILTNSKEAGFDVVLQKNNTYTVGLVSLLCILILLRYLKSEKFIKRG